jgi:hypothetical protein
MVTRNLPNADIAFGAKVARLTHLANISCRIKKPLEWDNAAGRFNFEEANALIRPEYSAPWQFPGY